MWQVEKELGERRAVGYSGVGLGISQELEFEAVAKEANSVGNVSQYLLPTLQFIGWYMTFCVRLCLNSISISSFQRFQGIT